MSTEPKEKRRELLTVLGGGNMTRQAYSEFTETVAGSEWIHAAAQLISEQPFSLIKFLEIAHANGQQETANQLRRTTEARIRDAADLKIYLLER